MGEEANPLMKTAPTVGSCLELDGVCGMKRYVVPYLTKVTQFVSDGEELESLAFIPY